MSKDSFLHRFFANLGALGIYVLPFLLGIFLVFSWFNGNFVAPLSKGSSEKIGFQVESGWNLQKVAQELESKALIKNWWSVYWLAKFKKENNGEPLKIVAGEYELSPAMSPNEILMALKAGKTVEHPLELPVGLTVKEAGKFLAATKLVTEEEAYDALRDQALMAQLGIPAFIPEGYLMEGTYQFAKPVTAKQIVTVIVEKTRKVFSERLENWEGRASELGFRPYEILTLASMLEKESEDVQERTDLSAVYHNRLRIGMQLHSNATLAYGIPDFNGTVSQQDIQTPGPYNTYLNLGLPPTPICTPSIEALKSALYPSEKDYLYYFRHPDGTFVYSSTFKEHQAKMKQAGLTPEGPAPAAAGKPAK